MKKLPNVLRLIRRQLTQAGINPDFLTEEMKAFVSKVDESYRFNETDRQMLERSLEISSAELLAANRDIHASAELLRRTLEATADGVLAIGGHGKVLHVNDRYFEILDIPRSIFEIEDTNERLQMIADRLVDPQAFLERMRLMLAGGSNTETSDIMALKSGRVVERSSRPLDIGDGAMGRVWSYRDITERHVLEQQLRHQAFHDSLTGLANRARFMDRVDHAMERSIRTGSPVHVLFMDVDNFKSVNDTLGHSKGDEAIRQLASRIAASLRAGDTAVRLGGDEFGLLIEDVDHDDDIEWMAKKLLAVARTPIEIDGSEVLLDASIGVATSNEHSTAEAMVRNADIAMYVAKNQGRGRYQFYEHGMHAKLSERQSLVADLRNACSRGEIVVYYQPAIVLSTGGLAGAEALVRWQHPVRGLIQPNDFIPLAEESGLIIEIGEYVMRDAVQLLRKWQQDPATAELSLGVNVAARQLRDRDFVSKVRQIVRDAHIRPDRLLIELTESAMLGDPDGTLITLSELKALGVRLALDDFGTGYSSLSYLKRFPIDVLKIDKSFIGDIDASEQDSRLASATITFGQQLKLSVLAEGIELADQLDQLIGLDCELGQGFLFSHPLERSEFDRFVREQVAADRAA